MKRKVLAMVLALIMVVAALAGCGKGDGKKTADSGESQKQGSHATVGGESTGGAAVGDTDAGDGEQVDITFWTHYTDDINFTKKKVEDFNNEYAGKIHVELNHIADDFNNVLLLALQNGNGPDIYADGLQLGQLVEMNYAAPLNDLMSDEMLARVEGKNMVGNNWFDGKWYSLPFRGYNFRLVWNKDLFEAAGLDPEAPPKSYDEVIEYAKKITEYGKDQDSQKYGFMLPTGEDWIWWIYGSQMAYANGESMIDLNTCTYQWEAYDKVVDLYLTLQEDGSLFPGGTTMQNDPARAQFAAGNVGMILAASWDIGVFNDQFPCVNEWGVATLPTYDGEFHGYTQLDAGSYLLINGASDDAHKKAAMTFYEYLLSEPTLIEYCEGGYGVPVYDGVADKVAKKSDRPGFAEFSDVTTDRFYPYEPPITIEGDGYGLIMNSVLNGAISMESAVADLNERYNAAVKAGAEAGDFNLDDYIVKGFSCMNPAGE